MSASRTQRSVGHHISAVFPDGTRPGSTASANSPKPGLKQWWLVPVQPADIFAISASLLRGAGVYHNVVPCNHSPTCSGKGCANGGLLPVGATELSSWTELGKALRLSGPKTHNPPPEVQSLWEELIRAWDEPLYLPPAKLTLQAWWRAALALMVISDCAAHHLGWHSPEPQTWLEEFYEVQFYNEKNGKFDHLPSVAVVADPDVVCVQPKSRTPGVGLGLRTLSHNLCLMPPQGEVSTAWMCPPAPPYHLPDESVGALNVLLMPFPYEIQDDCWRGGDGWFELKQGWLENSDGTSKDDAIIDFISATVLQAKQQLQKDAPIHGIVFPEYALNTRLMLKLVETIREHAESWEKVPRDVRNEKTKRSYPFRDIEFVVAGSSDYHDVKGNFVLQALLLRHSTDPRPQFSITGRSKHHRWIIDKSQVKAYALQHVLGDGRWAENIKVQPRTIQTFVFRKGSSFASMICEDLARSDPCLDVLRDLGPNIVFVLLMDGPQTPTRWSARYAQALSDDPGCAVLNVTSLALIERANGTGVYPRSRSIALFRGTNGKTHEIVCPEGYHGTVVSLRGARCKETTLDGRDSEDSIDWSFERYVPVRVYDAEKRKALFDP